MSPTNWVVTAMLTAISVPASISATSPNSAASSIMPAETRIGEDHLGHDHAGDQEVDLQQDHRERRDHGVAQGVGDHQPACSGP